MKPNARSQGVQEISIMRNPILLKIVMACILWLLAVLFTADFAVAQETPSDTEGEPMSFSFPDPPDQILEEEIVTEETQLLEGSTVTLVESIAPSTVATGQELLPLGHYWVRIGFEEFGEATYVTTEYLPFGIEFQGIGLDGTESWGVGLLPPFGGLNLYFEDTVEMAKVIASPWGRNFLKNTRWINLEQPASHVFFWASSGQAAPPPAWTRIKAYDGPFGAGTELFSAVLPKTPRQLVDVSSSTYNIESLTVQSVGNRAGIDNFTFDSGVAPKGGNIDISSNTDLSTPPTFFLDGTPSFLGRFQSGGGFGSISPGYILSIDEGAHVVTLYSPGYEWHQEHINVVTGQDSMISGNLVPVSLPTLRPEPIIQALGTDIDVGQRARPYLIDWNGDTLADLLAGNALGEVLVFLNTNTNADPMYNPATTVLPSMGFNATPIALQFYHNGMKHLVVGYGDGSVEIFFNTGTDVAPAFAGSEFDTTLVTGAGTDAVPCMADLDGDEKTDLIVGYADGAVYYHPNQRLDASPAFGGGIFLCSVASHASPAAVCDWDGDGLIDLVVGDGSGFLNLFLNAGTAQSPSYSASTQVLDSTGAPINAGAFAHPLVAYVDDDQIKDILLGKGDGTIKPYLSAITNLPPVANAGGPYEAECAGATTTIGLDGTASSDPDEDPLTYSWSSDCPGASFDDAGSATPALTVDTCCGPVICAVTLTVSDGTETDTDTVSVTIVDTTPPELTLSVSPHMLWPANHKMIPIVVTFDVTDICDAAPSVVLTSVINSEADDSAGGSDGSTRQDVQEADFWTEDTEFLLRAERAGKGDGRVYTVTYSAVDASGNETQAQAVVEVPHDSSSHHCEDPDCDLNGT